MLTFSQIKDNPVVLRSMTSLDLNEFEYLCVAFGEAWKIYFGREKNSEYTGRGRPPTLKTLEDNLLFILFYLKCYPLQTIIGFLFGMKQSTANELIHHLSKVILITLQTSNMTPERDPGKLPEYIEGENQELSIDATERQIERPSDNETQKEYYSGKAKFHAVKQTLIVGNNDRQVKYLGETHNGKKHDKKMADEEAIKYPKGTLLNQDTGYQGYQPEDVEVKQPKKKPKGKELTTEEKENNCLLSSIRVVVEHVIGGVKRLHIVKDVYRNKKENYEDMVMEIACGLHNLRTQFRLISY